TQTRTGTHTNVHTHKHTSTQARTHTYWVPSTRRSRSAPTSMTREFIAKTGALTVTVIPADIFSFSPLLLPSLTSFLPPWRAPPALVGAKKKNLWTLSLPSFL